MSLFYTIIIGLFCCYIPINAVVFPILSYSKDTGPLLGVFYQEKIYDTGDLQAIAMSQKKGPSLVLSAQNLPINDDRLNLQFYGSTTGQNYYGIANTSKKETDAQLKFSELSISSILEKPLTQHWDALLGIQYDYYKEKEPPKIFKNLNTLSFILGLQMDRRDQEINSTNGYYNELKWQIYPDQYILSNDIRYFYPISHSDIIASRLYVAQTITDTPHIQTLQGVGNYFYMRGYTANGIMDKFLAMTQLEWRKKVTSWLVLSPFIEWGTIGSKPSRRITDLFSYGLATHIPMGVANLRIELAFADTNKELYFGFNHTF
jgi:outer membrane protein assembly factor BamA